MVLLSGIKSCNRYDIFTGPQLTPLLLFFGMEIWINTCFLNVFKSKRFSKIALLQATDEFPIFRANVELKSFGFFCVVVGQQYSLNFILVSYFHFKMFGVMADIFLLAVICIFSLCILTVPVILEELHVLLLSLWEDRIENSRIIINNKLTKTWWATEPVML